MQKTPALSPARAVSTTAMAHLFEASIAPATRRAYQGALTRLEVWLDGAALDDAALATYLGALDQAEKSPAVAGQVVAAVRFRARLIGWPGCGMRRSSPSPAMLCCAPVRSRRSMCPIWTPPRTP